ncbi:Acyl-CoA:glycerol-3-phosphate acyltransferase [Fasciola hepatica]|uniref:Acyl-CoA:glycerol-3-phosphate acyltransferase n=1 Tax=Fasciola hepatica TaxID=6192 RepID=A0A4E0RKV6_FASHE|nr:Acyl-CoA:glycerol-3-phosphate acyltransferase [Fasciola hepatica]
MLENALRNLQDTGVELGNNEKLCDLDYADDLVCLFECTEHAQSALDRLAKAVAPFGVRFAPSKCKVMLQDWMSTIPSLMFDGEVLAIVDPFTYLGSSLTTNGSKVVEVSTRIFKARVPYVGLKHLWRQSDISRELKGRMYCATVLSVLLCSCETWGLRAGDIRHFDVFDHRCLRSIARIGWNDRVSDAEVRNRVFGTNSENVLSRRIQISRLRWLGHVLRMANTRLSYHALFLAPPRERKKLCGGQQMK